MLKYGCILIISILLIACTQNNKQAEVNNQPPAADTVSKPSVSTSPISPSLLIIPGQSIGKIRINQNADSVQNVLGKPDQINTARGKAVITWTNKSDTPTYQTQLYAEKLVGSNDDTSRIKQIRITSPLFKTNKNVQIGTDLKKIESSYLVQKAVMYVIDGKHFYIYDDRDDGIAFEIDTNEKCVGIIVHEYGGKIVTKRRFAFHPNTQFLQ